MMRGDESDVDEMRLMMELEVIWSIFDGDLAIEVFTTCCSQYDCNLLLISTMQKRDTVSRKSIYCKIKTLVPVNCDVNT